MGLRDLRLVGMLVLSIVASGCGTAATISRADGTSVTGEIERGNRKQIYLKTAAGGTVMVPKDTVTDIDHPGDAAIVVGLSLTALGVLAVSQADSKCAFAEEKTQCQIGYVTPAIVGLPMLLWGLDVHSGSKIAMDSDTTKNSDAWDTGSRHGALFRW
jgi:hypothetical protein